MTPAEVIADHARGAGPGLVGQPGGPPDRVPPAPPRHRVPVRLELLRDLHIRLLARRGGEHDARTQRERRGRLRVPGPQVCRVSRSASLTVTGSAWGAGVSPSGRQQAFPRRTGHTFPAAPFRHYRSRAPFAEEQTC
jgi:hypothetical protein